MLRRALIACLLVLSVLPVAATARPHAYAAKTCDISGQQRKLGTSYVLSLKSRRVSCPKAKRTVKAFHSCRHKNGKAGRCRGRVRGFRCSEKRLSASSIQYDARVTCKRGSKRVKHTYTQNT